MPFSTMRRLEAVQRWPVEKNEPCTALSTATARSAIDIGAWHSSTMCRASNRSGADSAAGAACSSVSPATPAARPTDAAGAAIWPSQEDQIVPVDQLGLVGETQQAGDLRRGFARDQPRLARRVVGQAAGDL